MRLYSLPSAGCPGISRRSTSCSTARSTNSASNCRTWAKYRRWTARSCTPWPTCPVHGAPAAHRGSPRKPARRRPHTAGSPLLPARPRNRADAAGRRRVSLHDRPFPPVTSASMPAAAPLAPISRALSSTQAGREATRQPGNAPIRPESAPISASPTRPFGALPTLTALASAHRQAAGRHATTTPGSPPRPPSGPPTTPRHRLAGAHIAQGPPAPLYPRTTPVQRSPHQCGIELGAVFLAGCGLAELDRVRIDPGLRWKIEKLNSRGPSAQEPAWAGCWFHWRGALE